MAVRKTVWAATPKEYGNAGDQCSTVFKCQMGKIWEYEGECMTGHRCGYSNQPIIEVKTYYIAFRKQGSMKVLKNGSYYLHFGDKELFTCVSPMKLGQSSANHIL